MLPSRSARRRSRGRGPRARSRCPRLGVAAVDGEPAEQQGWNGVGRAFRERFGRGRSVDAGHRDARVCDDDVVGVGDHPGGGGVASAVLAGVAAQPFVEYRFAAVELFAVDVGAGRAAPADAGQSSQLNVRLRRIASASRSLTSAGRSSASVNATRGIGREADARALGQDLLRLRRRGLHHERGDVEVRRGRSAFEQRLVRGTDADLETFFLDR